VSRSWLDDAPFADSHPGDLEWWYASVAPDALEAHLRVWERGGSVVGWCWITKGGVHWEIRGGEPSADQLILETILHETIDETDGTLEAWAAEDDAATVATLGRLGFRQRERCGSQFQYAMERGLGPAMDLPAGYRIRGVDGPNELPARVEAHRAAFAPSRMTIEKYARLTTLPHYRFEDDLIVEAPDGSIAAFAMAWWDPVARVGEYEPVGTHPAHRRRGLGRALLGHGLRRYRDLGAGLVQVYSKGDNAASEGLYQAVGFERRRHRHLFERQADRR
jgi:ribosomal protein S18 acetylase RimI-like enzyme